MSTDQNLKEIVQSKYSKIALEGNTNSSCCGSNNTANKIYNIMMDDYSNIKGYEKDADLSLGCGLPTQFAQIKPGDTVVDLGSGAGNDCFVARHETGPTGKVIGIDFTDAMINKARLNADKLGYNNVEFRFGDIENMPLISDSADVVVSNCVLNLVPNKPKVISEIYRVLKPGGHFSISDIVLVGTLPTSLKSDAELYAGCVAGAIQKEDYISLISTQGFTNITLQKEKVITLPDDLLEKYLTSSELEEFKQNTIGIFSISVYAEKPSKVNTIDSEIEESPYKNCC